MKKNLASFLVFACVVFLFEANAFNPENTSRSLVKITIVDNGIAKTTASGFVYKDNRHIITSLHVMRPGANVKIKIEYNGLSCNARVIKVLKRADLVLLEAIPGSSNTLPPWTPILTVNSNPLKFAENIFSIGFNSGSRSWISRKLSKGSGASEKLNDLIPHKDVTQIRNLGMPDLNLNVIYIDGSLLPGFSGAPLLNDQGQLIGIADGGLENGASNVSWGIPGREIDALFASSESMLPTSIESAPIVFSAEVDAPLQTSIIRYNNYQFVHTKTRTLQELIDRSDDRETLLTWLHTLGDLRINYSSIAFDIYEDIVNGFIITVPHGKKLAIEHNMLSPQLSQTEDPPYYLGYTPGNILGETTDGELNYHAMEEGQKELAQYLTDSLGLDEALMVTEDKDEYKIKPLSNGYLATSGFYIHSKTSTEEIASYIYCKFIITHESSVVCIAIIKNYTTETLKNIGTCMQAKIDCDAPGVCAEACTITKDWLHIMASVNLTTVADNK